MEYNTYEVFTPSRPAKLTFVERQSLNDKLVDALRTPGKQLVVYGHSGSGKTTLLMNKLEQLYSAHIISRCMGTTTFESLLLEAFDQLAPFYEVEVANKKGTEKKVKLAGEYAGIKSQIQSTYSESTDTKSVRAVPYQLTPAKLAELIGCIKGCWVLEDFHKVQQEEKPKISQLMKIFMDMAIDFDSVKIVAIGAVGTAREVVQYDKEMSKRVSEIYVPLMSLDELKTILSSGEKLLNIEFLGEIKDDIARYSNGLASVCHQLALNICQVRQVYSTAENKVNFGKTDFDNSVTKYVEEESDSIKAAFDMATKRHKTRKYDNCNIILKAMLSGSEDGMSHAELLKEIEITIKEYPPSNLAKYLKELQSEMRGGIVIYDPTTNKYRYANPFIRAYAMAIFESKKPNSRIVLSRDNIVAALTEAFMKRVDPGRAVQYKRTR